MTAPHVQWWRRSSGRPVRIWLMGAVLIWLTMPASVLDIFLAPGWFAPHWQCDSLGIPMLMASRAALPYAGFALVMAGVLTLVAARGRTGGTDCLDLRWPRSARGWGVSLVAALLIAPLVYDIGRYVSEVAILRTWTENCNGRAEDITVTLRRPPLQVLPVVEACLILWLLHLRATALSPRRGVSAR